MKKSNWDFNQIKEGIPYEERIFQSENYKIFSWALSPGNYKKTIIILHGFLDHSKTNQITIKWFLDHSFRVIAADMPGHGKSDGNRGGIESFDSYYYYFIRLLEAWQIDPAETFALGHSTGSSILIDYCRKKNPNFRGIIFAAPLVKIGNYIFVVKGFDFAQTKINEVPIKKTKSCNNRSFLKFKWDDPLGVKRFSMSWIKAMVDWNEKWVDFTSNVPLLIIQGKKDRTVEWKKNIPILEKCFSHGKVVMVKRARHHILNENDKICKSVYREINAFLELHD